MNGRNGIGKERTGIWGATLLSNSIFACDSFDKVGSLENYSFCRGGCFQRREVAEIWHENGPNSPLYSPIHVTQM